MVIAILSIPFSGFSTLLLLLFAAVGLTALCFGGDWLTNGAAGLSINLKINPVVVGLTIVSIATSMPELITTLIAARESPGIAIGNILGSNIANIGLILGIAAMISPMVIQLRLIRREVPHLIGVTILFLILAWGELSRVDGLIMLSLTIFYLVFFVFSTLKEPKDATSEFEINAGSKVNKSTKVYIYLILVGGIALALGADLLVGSSVEFAGRIGISETLIGFTLVAIGTSLPELFASIAAARSGHGDICAGNIVGSNLFNMLLIGGCVATIVPIPVDKSLYFVEFPCMLGFTVLLLFMFKTGHIVTRREGSMLLALYVAVLVISIVSRQVFFYN